LLENASVIAESSEKDLIFLLGAGASVDAGMPTVAQLTKELKARLPKLRDVNGRCRDEFVQIFDLIKIYDTSVDTNYERFFEWIYLLIKAQTEPFRNLIKINVDTSLVEAMADLTLVIGGEIARLLASRKTEPNYLTRIGDFLPPQGRLKVFTLNYDCCLEDACHNAGIDLTTGFDPSTKKWNPSLFQRKSKGINLYKLHGSLRWFGTRDMNLANDQFQHDLVLMELEPGALQYLPSNIDVTQRPELVLGPGSKVQPDDPFLTLLYEFQRSLHQAKVCVIIGYSHRDDHINKMLSQAFDRGLSILDVNLGQSLNSRYLGDRYHHVQLCAKRALIDGNINSELSVLAAACNP
jgi:hypothetical protein